MAQTSKDEIQGTLDRIREALDTPDLVNPLQRLIAVQIAMSPRISPPTESDIRQATEVAFRAHRV